MASITGKDAKEEPLQLKQQGGSKVFSKLFTRESSAAAPSFRVYYGVASAGSVPFLWESQPGTPKNDAVSTATLPPLTPPPSYYTARQQKPAAATSGAGKKHSKHLYSSIFSAILPKIILHRRSRSSSSSSGSPSASSCSSSSSAFSSSSAASSASSLSFRSAQSPAVCSSMRSRVYAFSAGDAAAAAAADSEEDERPAAPTCFSVRHESFRAFKGCRVAMTVKSALASVGGHGAHGHGHGPTTAAQKV